MVSFCHMLALLLCIGSVLEAQALSIKETHGQPFSNPPGSPPGILPNGAPIPPRATVAQLHEAMAVAKLKVRSNLHSHSVDGFLTKFQAGEFLAASHQPSPRSCRIPRLRLFHVG